MTKKALRFDAGDNVAVALEAMSAGDRVLINGEDAGIEIREALPQGHKLALRRIARADHNHIILHLIRQVRSREQHLHHLV